MSVLPASVRVAVWATTAMAGTVPVEQVVSRALPDIDDVEGLTPQLRIWRELGERAVLVALPRPGDVSGLPTGAADLAAAATSAEEAVYVPGIGGALVPTIARYGRPDDEGWRVVWTGYDADPVPVHRVQSVDLADVELRLRQELVSLTAAIEGVPGAPMGGSALETALRDGLDVHWGMPEGIPRRALRVVDLAGSVLTLADVGRDAAAQTVDSGTTLVREQLLRRLADHAATALAQATNVAALHLAGWR